MKKQDLIGKTRAELLSMATTLKITGRHKMTKDNLIASLKKTFKTATEKKKRTPSKTKPKSTPASKKQQAKPSQKAVRKRTVVRQKKAKQEIVEPPLQETVERAKFELSPPRPLKGAPSTQELPAAYGETQITVMVRDPYWAYAYWEIEPYRLKDIQLKLGKKFDMAMLILRVYDITNVVFNGTNANRTFDIAITGGANSWHIHLGVPNRMYCVDIGIRTAQGRFYCLARSGSVSTPRDTISEIVDEHWLATAEEFETIYALAKERYAGVGSLELQEQVSSPGLFSMRSSPFSRQKK
jgi:hypothetical protein